MIKEFNSFLNKKECNNVINFFKKNSIDLQTYNDTIILNIIKNFSERKKILNKIKKFNLKLNYDQIVLWPSGSLKHLHKDGVSNINNDFTAVCYLNNEYKGGRTIIDNKFIDNSLGKLVLFHSKELLHGVEQVIGKRIVYISWWKKVIF